MQRIGVAIDCCSERLYPQLRGGSLADSTALVKGLARRYPGRISTHLIIGLGEDESEAAELMLDLHGAGVLVSLFAFTPVRGTAMEHGAPPSLVSYRKLQLLLGLLDWQEEELFSVAYDSRKSYPWVWAQRGGYPVISAEALCVRDARMSWMQQTILYRDSRWHHVQLPERACGDGTARDRRVHRGPEGQWVRLHGNAARREGRQTGKTSRRVSAEESPDSMS